MERARVLGLLGLVQPGAFRRTGRKGARQPGSLGGGIMKASLDSGPSSGASSASALGPGQPRAKLTLVKGKLGSSARPRGGENGYGAWDSARKPPPQHDILVAGVPVSTPFKPYPAQLALMGGCIKAFKNGTNALLESPTGSGKTMALLCSSLGWQRWEAERLIQEDQEQDVSRPGCPLLPRCPPLLPPPPC